MSNGLRIGVMHMSLHLQKLFFTISTLKHLHDDVLEERFSDKHIPSVTAIEKTPHKCSKWS